MFGTDIRFEQEDKAGVTMAVRINEVAMMQFAGSFAPDVVILEPERLREKMKEDLGKTLEFFKKEMESTWRRKTRSIFCYSATLE